MATAVPFQNYDSVAVYQSSQKKALKQSTKNFVVEFGREQAQIAFDVSVEDVQTLLRTVAPVERPVRWINLWGPHNQESIVDLLGKHYEFSPRLLAIMKTEPPGCKIKAQKVPRRALRAMLHRTKDVETAAVGDDMSEMEDEKPLHGIPLMKAGPLKLPSPDGISHYALAKKMTNYHSIDVGSHYICAGANFMHEIISNNDSSDIEVISEGVQKRLWSWLILCDDHTVLSLHEHPGHVSDERDLKSFRANTFSVLTQLSNHGHGNGTVDPISMQTIRPALKDDDSHPSGIEGSSLLFYYLFDDWEAVYTTVVKYSERLAQFDAAILFDMWKKSYQQPDTEIIPRLHKLGRQGRQLNHLYAAYKNLVSRILDSSKAAPTFPSLSASQSDLSSINGQRGVHLATSASQRFERLKDRLELLIIEQMKESLAERDALVNTYFNITAQKDSESTARLTRSATLLAKLSVLFLPVSLMTSYFSIQVSDLVGVYTVQDYWYAFAGIMSFSFLALFFFSRMLMWVTETLDTWMRQISRACGKFIRNRLRRKKERGD